MTSHIPHPHTCTALPIINLLQSMTFITTHEPALTHYNLPKATVYIIVHSSCSTFYKFGQMNNDMYLSYSIIHCSFTVLKILKAFANILSQYVTYLLILLIILTFLGVILLQKHLKNTEIKGKNHQ